MMKPMVLLGVAMAVSLLGAADTIVTETVNDLAPYDNTRSDSFWNTTAYSYTTVRVTTSEASFDPAALLQGTVKPKPMAVDTMLEAEGSAFLDILSTISPGLLLLLK